ncbi:MAG: response regulator [Phycisphaerales bacterium]|nr:response regulator [Phycisphaerales bacterium]
MTDNHRIGALSGPVGKIRAIDLKPFSQLSILEKSASLRQVGPSGRKRNGETGRGENVMGMTKVKDVLTTGEVAKICNVAPRTVSKWFDSGALHGYRIPGSKDRRIPLNQLIRFMKQHGMPLNGLMTGCTRIMIVDDEQDIVEVLEKILEDEAKYEVEVAKGGFAAGLTAEKFRPHVILLDVHLSDVSAREVARQVKANPDLQLTKVIAMSGKMTDEESKGLMAGGFDGFLRKPFHVRQVIEAIEDAMAVVY